MERMSIERIKLECVAKDRRIVAVQLSEEELENNRKESMSLHIEQDTADETFAELRRAHDKDKKARAKRVKELVKANKTRRVERDIVVYDVPDEDAGLMLTFDEQGEEVERRRLLPSERQTRVFNSQNVVNG